MSFNPAQCRAARALLGWSQGQLAEASGVATKTIADFEREDRSPYERTLNDIHQALARAGVSIYERRSAWGENETVAARR